MRQRRGSRQRVAAHDATAWRAVGRGIALTSCLGGLAGAVAACSGVDVAGEGAFEEAAALEASRVIDEGPTLALEDPTLRECATINPLPRSGDISGWQPQGVELHGTWNPMNGIAVEVPRRFRLSTMSVDGRPIYHAQVRDGRLAGYFDPAATSPLTEWQWVGAELEAELDCESGFQATYRARVAEVSALGYRIEIEDRRGSTTSMKPACRGEGEEAFAVPFAEVWGADGSRVTSAGRFTFACRTSAVAKCAAWGYDQARFGDNWASYHQACTRMARADYCGDGTSATVDGTVINQWDRLRLVPPDPDGVEDSFEAAWGPGGATCMDHRRHAERPVACESGLPPCSSASEIPRSALATTTPPLVFNESSALHRQYSSLYVRNWPSTAAGLTQWSDVVVVNPTGREASMALTIHGTDGGRLGSIQRRLPPGGDYTSAREADWRALPDSDPANRRSLGWISLESDAPLVATVRSSIREGSTVDAPVHLFDDEPFIKARSKQLYSSYYLKSWPSTAGITQWSNLIVNNPTRSSAEVTVKIHGNDGATLATLTRAVPAKGLWNSYGDSGWLGTAGASVQGWVEVTSTVPVFATNRVALRSGTTYDAPLVLVDDVALTRAPSSNLHATVYFRNIAAAGGTLMQWSNPVVNNPNPTATRVDVFIHRTDGGADLASFSRTIQAYGSWSADGDPSFRNVPDTHGTGRTLGWVEIRASNPVVAMNRVTLRDGSTESSPVAQLNDEPMQAASAGELVGGAYLKNWPFGGDLTQWSTPTINNPNDFPVTMAIEVRGRDGRGLLAAFTRTIPAKGWWNAWGDASWDAATETDPVNHRSIGWVDISAPAPLLGMNRVVVRQGTTTSSPLVLLDAIPLGAAASRGGAVARPASARRPSGDLASIADP